MLLFLPRRTLFVGHRCHPCGRGCLTGQAATSGLEEPRGEAATRVGEERCGDRAVEAWGWHPAKPFSCRGLTAQNEFPGQPKEFQLHGQFEIYRCFECRNEERPCTCAAPAHPGCYWWVSYSIVCVLHASPDPTCQRATRAARLRSALVQCSTELPKGRLPQPSVVPEVVPSESP